MNSAHDHKQALAALSRGEPGDQGAGEIGYRAREFVNEIGNTITLILAPLPSGQYALQMCGPRSVSENVITKRELRELSTFLSFSSNTSPRDQERRDEDSARAVPRSLVGAWEIKTEQFPADEVFTPGGWQAYVKFGDLGEPGFAYGHGEGATEIEAIRNAANALKTEGGAQ